MSAQRNKIIQLKDERVFIVKNYYTKYCDFLNNNNKKIKL